MEKKIISLLDWPNTLEIFYNIIKNKINNFLEMLNSDRNKLYSV